MGKSKYNPETFPALAEKYAKDGMTDEEIAASLGISVSSFYNYQDKHLEFLESLKRGKADPDKKIEQSLYKRAFGGFEVEETQQTIRVMKDGTEKVIFKKVTKKTVPPDTTACIFWLKNRKSQEWKDKPDLADLVEGIDITLELKK